MTTQRSNQRESNSTDRTQYGVAVYGEGKNMLIAYLFWWFLGLVGAHRFYLDRVGSAIGMIVLFVLGFITFFITWIPLCIWWLIDGFLVYKYVSEINRNAGDSAFGMSFVTTKDKNIDVDLGSLTYVEKVFDLKERGIITEDEYLRRKDKALSGDQHTRLENNDDALHVNPPTDHAKNSAMIRIVALERLAELHKSGTITDEEFASEKQKIMRGNA